MSWVRRCRVSDDDGKTRRGEGERQGEGGYYAHRLRMTINPHPNPSMTDLSANASSVLEACWIVMGPITKLCARSCDGTV